MVASSPATWRKRYRNGICCNTKDTKGEGHEGNETRNTSHERHEDAKGTRPRKDAGMSPTVGRIAFNIGVLLIVLSLIPLPFLPVGSAEFIVDVIALVLSSIFLALVVWSVRRQARLPKKKPGEKSPPGGEEK